MENGEKAKKVINSEVKKFGNLCYNCKGQSTHKQKIQMLCRWNVNGSNQLIYVGISTKIHLSLVDTRSGAIIHCLFQHILPRWEV